MNRSTEARDLTQIGLIQIGKIVSPYGIKGGVKVLSYAESSAYYEPQRRIVLIGPAGDRSERKIVASQAAKQIVRVYLDQIVTRNQARELVGCDIFVSREGMPPLEADTYYWADLIGMEVVTGGGELLGRIDEIIATGANDVYVVKTPAGHPAEEILIPAIASVVLAVDTAAGRMTVDLPEGLI